MFLLRRSPDIVPFFCGGYKYSHKKKSRSRGSNNQRRTNLTVGRVKEFED